MKAIAIPSRIFLMVLFGLVASCVTTDNSNLERNPKALGWRTGRADALAGMSQNYERHLHELHPSADEDDYEDAYEDAYDDAEEEMEHRQEAAEEAREHAGGRAYDRGHGVGEHDRELGLSRNPYRHGEANAGSASESRSWVQGYTDGWNER